MPEETARRRDAGRREAERLRDEYMVEHDMFASPTPTSYPTSDEWRTLDRLNQQVAEFDA